MNDPQRSTGLASNPLRDGPPATDEDEQALGWECANPALQIERWLHEMEAAPALQSSNS